MFYVSILIQLQRRLHDIHNQKYFRADSLQKMFPGATEMALQALAAKPDNPSFIPGNYVMEGENQFLQRVLRLSHTLPQKYISK